ncbi:hypothetical protein JST56_00175 [Candidatus Dependentiae bacterium]|nr:hypothetical protein [Candidatus Dependentiae bacterium]
MNIVVALGALVFLPIMCCAQASEFLVTKKQVPTAPRCSASKLKEQLGHATKDAFHASRSLIRHIGKINMLVADLQSKKVEPLVDHNNLITINKQGGELLITLSALQKKFSATLGCLLDNQAPFKRAGKNDLSTAHAIMYDLVASLEKNRQQLKSCQNLITQSMDKKSTPDSIQQEIGQLQKKSLHQAVAQLSATMLDVCQQSKQLHMRVNADNCLKQAS